MQVGQSVAIRGFVTQLKFINGRDLQQMETLLGYHAGRLGRGAVFSTLDRLPEIDEFATAGYSQVADHRHVPPADLDPVGLRKLAMSAWSLFGPDRLIKLMPTTPHDRFMEVDAQYPPGLGVPQWKLTQSIPGRVVAVLTRYGEALRVP